MDDELERREERELEVIRGQMGRTRAALGEKLEALETQVKDTVQVATEGVAAAVEGVKETVETVSETVETVTETLNVSRTIENHPWESFGCSVATGFALGYLTGGDSAPQTQQQAAPHQPLAAPSPSLPAPAQAAQPMQPAHSAGANGSIGEKVWDAAGSAGNKLWDAAMMGLRALGIKALSGVMRNLISDSGLPREMHQELHKFVGGISVQLGLKPEENPVPPPQPEGEQHHEEQKGRHDNLASSEKTEGPQTRRHNNRPAHAASA